MKNWVNVYHRYFFLWGDEKKIINILCTFTIFLRAVFFYISLDSQKRAKKKKKKKTNRTHRVKKFSPQNYAHLHKHSASFLPSCIASSPPSLFFVRFLFFATPSGWILIYRIGRCTTTRICIYIKL